MLSAADLRSMSRPELTAVVRAGHAVDADAIADTEYRGISLGLPAFIEELTWKTFKKVFCRNELDRSVRGWNVRIEQTGLEPPFRPKRRNGAPVTFGHFAVEVRSNGLLLDYGAGAPRFDPLGLVRDPVVAVNPGDPSLLVGTTYLALPFGDVPTPSFFSLELDGPLTHRASR